MVQSNMIKCAHDIKIYGADPSLLELSSSIDSGPYVFIQTWALTCLAEPCNLSFSSSLPSLHFLFKLKAKKKRKDHFGQLKFHLNFMHDIQTTELYSLIHIYLAVSQGLWDFFPNICSYPPSLFLFPQVIDILLCTEYGSQK